MVRPPIDPDLGEEKRGRNKAKEKETPEGKKEIKASKRNW